MDNTQFETHKHQHSQRTTPCSIKQAMNKTRSSAHSPPEFRKLAWNSGLSPKYGEMGSPYSIHAEKQLKWEPWRCSLMLKSALGCWKSLQMQKLVSKTPLVRNNLGMG